MARTNTLTHTNVYFAKKKVFFRVLVVLFSVSVLLYIKKSLRKSHNIFNINLSSLICRVIQYCILNESFSVPYRTRPWEQDHPQPQAVQKHCPFQCLRTCPKALKETWPLCLSL